MLEQINIELLKLQEELSKLKSASEQIAQAGKVSFNIIEATEKLNEQFRDTVKKIQDLVSDYLNKTYKYTEENLTKLFYSFQQRIKEEEELLKKFTDLSAQSEDLIKQAIKAILDENKKKFDQIVKSVYEALDKQKQLLEDYANKVKQNVENLNQKYQQNLEQQQAILASYLELAETTAKLTKVIESIDFPRRLDKIDARILDLYQNQQALNAIFEELTQKQTDTLVEQLNTIIKNQEDIYNQIILNTKKLNTTKAIVWTILVIVLLYIGFTLFAFFSVFKDFFDAFIK